MPQNDAKNKKTTHSSNTWFSNLVTIVPVILGTIALYVFFQHLSADHQVTGPVAEKAVDFELPFAAPVDTKVKSFILKAERGKPVVLNFWATWCTACREEMPYFDYIWKRRQKLKPFNMIGIAVNDSAANVQASGRTSKDKFPVVLDADGSIARAYGVTNLPQTVLIGPAGQIVLRFPTQVGMLQQSQLETMLGAEWFLTHAGL